MRKQNIIRVLLFVVFFASGAAALSGSILCDDLVKYYAGKQQLKAARETLTRLESLNADYDVLLRQLQAEPNFVERLGPAALGVEPPDANAIYPQATLDQLAAARRVLAEDSRRRRPDSALPDWLTRSSRPAGRVILFIAGAFLVVIAFACFGFAKQPYPQR